MTPQSVKKQGTFEQLKEFINKAEKLGKYPRNTAVAMLPALKIVQEGLIEDEPDTTDYVIEHLEEIFNRKLKSLNLSAGSLQTYIARVKRAISDFKKYGQDPKTLLAWKPKSVQRATKTRNGSSKPETISSNPQGSFSTQTVVNTRNIGLRTVVWSLRPDL
ncbi:MAG TPA: hypothetical protein VLY20_09930, partial [Nitrospiria bacterium]|nr:hypothetical protein [Nitrospiria bacterium]